MAISLTFNFDAIYQFWVHRFSLRNILFEGLPASHAYKMCISKGRERADFLDFIPASKTPPP